MTDPKANKRTARSVYRTLIASCFVFVCSSMTRAQQGVDVVFMVDTSGIVADWDTADAARLKVAHGVVEGMRDLGPSRVGVLSLAGDEADAPGGWVTLPLTALPDNPADVSAFLDSTVHSSLSSLGSTEACLPLNTAVEKHLPQMLNGRGDPSRPLWLVLLTHGEVDPVSPVGDDEWVTDAIRARTEEMTGLPYDEADRPEIRAAAAALLLEGFPAQAAGFGQNVVVSVVDVNAHADPAKKGQRVQAMSNGQSVDLLASLTDQQLLTLDGSNARSVVERLLAQAPFPPLAGMDGVITRELSGAPTQRFRIYQGTDWARLSLLADHGDFTVELSYVEGDSAPGFYAAHGDGQFSRSVDLAQPSAGLIELSVTPNPGAADLNLAASLRFKLDIDVLAQGPANNIVLPVGTQLDLEVRLRDNVGGGLISDTHLLENGKVTATWTAPGGAGSDDQWAPAADETHTASYAHNSTTQGSQPFAWAVEASLLKTAQGSFDWTDSTAGQANLEFATPALTMAFATADDDVAFADGAGGSSLTFGPEWVSGSVTSQATLQVTVDLHGSGGEVPVVLRFEPSAAYGSASADGAVSASLSLDGSPISDSRPIAFADGASRVLTVTVSKSGIPPFGGQLGTVVAEMASGDTRTRAQVDLAMSPAFGIVTIGSLLGLLLLLALLLLFIRQRMRAAAYGKMIAGLSDTDLVYFNDDEPGAPAHGAAS